MDEFGLGCFSVMFCVN